MTTSDVIYLKTVVGKILPKAVSEIVEKRPPDPIEELAKWLYHYADSELYYYEKAIFAKELQLLAIQLNKETSSRLARIAALKKETDTMKYLLANKRLLDKFLPIDRFSCSTMGLLKASLIEYIEADLQRFAKDFTAEGSANLSRAFTESQSAITKIISTSETSRRKPRKITSFTSTSDFGFDTRLERRRQRKQDELSEDSTRSGKQRRRQKALLTETDEGLQHDSDDLYGEDAKLKYGFEVTPVKCHWYLAEPNVLVCVHPVLGEMRSRVLTEAPHPEMPEYWEEQDFAYAAMYDHEIYININPHHDDVEYKQKILAWADVDTGKKK